MKHTPTPWSIPQGAPLTIVDKNGHRVVDVLMLWDGPQEKDAQKYESKKQLTRHIVHCVNLFPEMLEALEDMWECFNVTNAEQATFWERVQYLILKAKGETT